MPAVTLRSLTKVYGAKSPQPVKALSQVSFEVAEGEIFGIIGPDGAGKTTAFKILSGVMEATSGEVRVLGAPPRDSRDLVGYLTQPFSLYLDMSVEENLRYSAGLRRIPQAAYEERRDRYLRLFDMERFSGRLAGKLSGGMKQKLALTCGLVSNPKLLLLDEPTTGVDPVSRRDFWDALARLSTEGMTIIVATPYLDEAERCHRVALIDRGDVYSINSPAGFRANLGLSRIEVKVGDLGRAERVFSKVRGLADVQRYGDRLDIMTSAPDAAERAVRETAHEESLGEPAIQQSPPTLENAVVATLRSRRALLEIPPFPGASRRRTPGATQIGAYQLNKRFGSFQAVRDFGIEIRTGEIYGLLGANGAGKTTAIKMLCGLLEPTSGRVELLGKRTGLRGAKVRSRIGYMSQRFSLYDDLSIGENLDFFGRMYSVPAEVREARKQWVLETSDLKGEEKMLTALLPGGWKQRVAFGSAIMHEPDIVFLDEPTSGVDPLARRAMWQMINELADHGAAVLVVTHYLEEAEQCNRLGFMVAGEIIAQGSPGEVKRAMTGTLYEVATGDLNRAAVFLKQEYGPSRVSLFGDRLHVRVEVSDRPGAGLEERLRGAGMPVSRCVPVEFSLEDVFISLIEQRRLEIPQ